MRSILKISIVAVTALLTTGGALAQATGLTNPGAATPPVGYGAPISLSNAKKLTAAAMAEADRIGVPMVVAITDPAGGLVYLEKHDIAMAGAVNVALAKGRSAALYKRPTKAFEDSLAAGGAGLRVLRLADAVPVEGGLPILIDGKLVGAIGVSGGSGAQDGAVAKAGLDSLR
jgi:uncharacterized protein GlcG (DUF336 family)